MFDSRFISKCLRQSALALSLVGAISQPYAFACSMDGKSGIVAENNLYIPFDSKATYGIDEAVFNKVIDDISAIYAPIIAEKGGELKVERNWSDGTVNAYAQRTGNVWMVSMFGGLARHETITADGFALVLCHELGHHLGGAPRKGGWFGTTWASNEGQSDYWGNMKCMRRYFAKDNNQEIVAKMNVSEFVTAKCQESFSNPEDVAMCQRGAMAGKSLGDLFQVLSRGSKPLDFQTPDARTVSTTNHNHPDSQCRLDTYFAGALCTKAVVEEVDGKNPAPGTCMAEDGFTLSARPRCWFKN